MKKLYGFILGTLIVSLFAISNVIAIDRVVYPLYSSTCCEFGTQTYLPESQPSITQTEQSYTCKVNSACQVRNPTVTCPGRSAVNLWLGYTAIWQIKGSGIYYSGQTKADGTQTGDTTAGNVGIPFSEGQTITYSGACANNANWVFRILTNGISMFFEGASPPTTSSMIIETKVGKLYQYPALEGRYSIDGTQYCQRNNQIEQFKNNLPKVESLGISSAELARIGSSSPSKLSTQTLLDTTRFYIDTCKRGVDKYIDLPFTFNVNPLGTKYNGQDVICSVDKGIISVVPLSTYGGSTYYVLGQRLKSSGFCCSNAQCQSAYGLSYNCDPSSYTCKEVQGYCNNDIDCMPEGGERIDNNCIRKNGLFYQWSSSCINHKCSPYPPSQTQVKCCPGYCSLTNQVCDPYIKGCYTPETPLPQCPSGYCCDGTNNQKQDCSSGLTCCYDIGDAHKGVCKSSCTVKPECESDSDCPKEKPLCKLNKCIGSEDAKLECLNRRSTFVGKYIMGYEWKSITSKEGVGYLGIGALVGWTKPVTTEYCSPSLLVIWIIAGVILFTIILFAFLLKPKSGSYRK